ncbi:uncharacterized protein LOC108742227 isoform X2 [Agrilus planipennis]|uniref:Uncharacterized protein LOC108742227 isoform X2 n=1 Tax=Agrilus planipennis TaxID=224129 RepID=A0A7F5RKJ9_AGRPL|nr:uncharacterized protein LOC108742227 isoform X2 [Agrilus planipennis]
MEFSVNLEKMKESVQNMYLNTLTIGKWKMIPSRRKNKQEITCTRTKSFRKLNKELKELVLPASKLKFCSDQLQNLNFILTRRILNANEPDKSKPILIARSVTERLIQRLLCTVGILDPRFASKYLVALHDSERDFSNKLEYIVRLDALSVPLLYSRDEPPQYVITEGGTEMCPHGYARLRFSGNTAKIWSEFLNSGGYLRRDKIQARMVEMLAEAASKQGVDCPTDIDDSTLCASPGKVVDPVVLHHILKIPPERHVYYGPVGNYSRFPDPRDFRLAIVDEPSGIRLRIGFLSPAIASVNIEVRLLVAIHIDSWPSTSDFPFRIPLWHADSLLYYRSAQTGMYLVGYGVHSSAWQIRVPAAEQMLLKNHSPFSTVTVLLKSLENILNGINAQHPKEEPFYKILNKYIVQTCVFFELEKDSFSPMEILMNWSPRFLSTIVLQVLDDLIVCLRSQFLSNYFFKSANLLANPGHLCEEDYNLEANRIKACMLRMFDESLTSLKTDKEFKKFLNSQNTEMALMLKWRNLVDGLMPPDIATRGRRMCFNGSKHGRDVAYSLYTNRQLESVGIVLKSILLVKEKLLQAHQDTSFSINSVFAPENPTDDIIYILVTILEQARDQYIETALLDPSIAKNLPKIKFQFDIAMTKLVESIRKDKDIHTFDLGDDKTIVKILLKWLYKGLDQSKKNMAPVLKPYLRNVFVFSNALSWHLEEITKKEYKDELEAMGSFAKLVTSSQISPAQGLVDSVNKNWNWAKSMLCSVEKSQLRLVFCPGRGKTLRHILYLPLEEQNKIDDNGLQTLNMIRQTILRNGYQTLPSKSYFSTFSRKDKNMEEDMPQHCILRDSSPMVLCLRKIHRNGDHRCAGDLIQSFVSLQKVSILQEITSSLPLDERLEILESVHHLLSERNKKHSFKNRSHTLGSFGNSRSRSRNTDNGLGLIQRYIPKEESAGIRIDDGSRGDEVSKNEDVLIGKSLIRNERGNKIDIRGNSLIGSCRAARIREDNNIIYFQDSFKVQSLSKKPSFKY